MSLLGECDVLCETFKKSRNLPSEGQSECSVTETMNVKAEGIEQNVLKARESKEPYGDREN